ncbi:MAG: T9SS type A sorting domain-containing protein [Ignavibacteriaceae bacterium]
MIQINLEEKKIQVILIVLVVCLFQIIPSAKTYAQSYVIKGNVSISTTPVQNASVTFVDNSDTSKKFVALTDTSGNYQIDIVTLIKSGKNNLPTKFELEQNYPNPFSTSTEIPYQLKSQSAVQVTIYDILGRVVRKFSVGDQAVGLHSIVWDSRNNYGALVATGIYFCRLQANGESQVKKMVLDVGGKNLFNYSPNLILPNISGIRKGMNVNLLSGSYTVQVDNTSNTYPAILSQQFTNVVIQSDTTLNFTVNTPNQAIIYLDSTQQIIRGFGAANIIQWRPDMTPAEIQTAFGNGLGQLGFTILRLRIPPDSTKFQLDIPSAKAASSMGVKIIATPWTPPAWMKSNNRTIGGTLGTSAYAAYAAHLKAFAETMMNNGAPLYAVSVQNEPDAHVNYESCFWNATQFLNFMKYNAPSVGVPVFMPESESFVHQLSDSTLNDSVAESHVAFIGGHIYGSGLGPYPLATSEGKELWMTEHFTTTADSANGWSTNPVYEWPAAIPVAKEINDCINAGMSAYVWWYIVRFYGPIDESGNVTKRGYVMSQFSKFIRPGYYKIKCNPSPQKNVYLTSYRDSSSSKVVLVALNKGSSPIYQTFSVEKGAMTSFLQYTTSATQNCQQGNNVSVTNGSFTAVLESSSITTFISN